MFEPPKATALDDTPTNSWFAWENFRTGSPIFFCVASMVGIKTRKQRLGLALAMLVPLVLLGLVTWRENCLWLGSVYLSGKTLNAASYNVLGMSFLGDPMVWGFCILVPLILVLCRLATERSLALLKAAASKASTNWKEDTTPYGFKAAVERTRGIWSLDLDWRWRLLKLVPWLVAGIFWVYNTATCGFQDYQSPEDGQAHWLEYPYKSKRIKLWLVDTQTFSPNLATESDLTRFLARTNAAWTTVLLAQKMPLPKWDCDSTQRPLSCWLTRIWTLFYYGLLPFLVAHLIMLVWGVTSFLRSGKRWEEQYGDSEGKVAFILNPFDPDGFGGLSPLSDAVISYLYVTSFFTVLLGLSFLKEGSEAASHDYALMLLFVPLGVWAVLSPSLAVRSTILRAKTLHLSQLAKELTATGSKLLAASADSSSPATADQAGKLEGRTRLLQSFYQQVNKMAEWPFDAMTLTRMVFPIAAPLLPTAIEKILSAYVK